MWSEELLQLLMPQLKAGKEFELAVQYSEGEHSLNAFLTLPQGTPNPLEGVDEEQGLRITRIKHLSADIGFHSYDDCARLSFKVLGSETGARVGCQVFG